MKVPGRPIAAAAALALVIGIVVTYQLHRSPARSHPHSASSAARTISPGQLQNAPRIVFRDTALGAGYGKVAMVSLADPAGPRALTGTSCDRVYAAPSRVLCLSSRLGVVNSYQAEVLDNDFKAERELPLAGIPSRARLSPDGTLAATTSFVAGDSYAGANFATRTVISPLTSSSAELDLSDFTLLHDGSAIAPADRNIWGVTFAGTDRTFYATAAWGGQTYLVSGDLQRRTLTTLHVDAECPSLSPDGRTVVYKKRNGQPAGHWRLAGYDLATGTERLLAETRNVDDQVEWLDSKTVLYGIARAGSQAATSDVFGVAADGSGSPRLVIAQAWSPAVVR